MKKKTGFDCTKLLLVENAKEGGWIASWQVDSCKRENLSVICYRRTREKHGTFVAPR